MRATIDWLVRHEKLLVGVTLCLVIALAVEVKIGGKDDVVGGNLGDTPAPAVFAKSGGPASDVSGKWEMRVPRRSGGAQIWVLTLAQKGEELTGNIKSEGGDLPVFGAISGQEIHLFAKRYGATVDFSAKLGEGVMEGTMQAAVISRRWSATRKKQK